MRQVPSVPTGDGALRRALTEIRDRVAAAAVASGRAPDAVSVLLATKTRTASVIAEAVRAGFPLIGENRVQEVVEKAPELADLLSDTAFSRHFIGHLQSNKVNRLLPLIDCVQTVDSAALAAKLAARAHADARRLDVFAQINVSHESSKSGVSPSNAEALVSAIADHAELRLRGLMTIGLNSPDTERVRAGYAELAGLRDRLAGRWADQPAMTSFGELSMGMSGDFEIAIAAGATMVRIGSAAFGARPAA